MGLYTRNARIGIMFSNLIDFTCCNAWEFFIFVMEIIKTKSLI